jgi:hypothetical protein
MTLTIFITMTMVQRPLQKAKKAANQTLFPKKGLWFMKKKRLEWGERQSPDSVLDA